MAQLIYYTKLKNYINIEQEPLIYFQSTKTTFSSGKAYFYIKNSDDEIIYTNNNFYPTIEANNERRYYFDNEVQNKLVNGNTYKFYFRFNTQLFYDSTTVICLSPPTFTLSGINSTLYDCSSAVLTVNLNNIHSDDYLLNFSVQLDNNTIYNTWDKSWSSSNFNIENLTEGEHVITVSGTSYLGFSLYSKIEFEVQYTSIHILFAFHPENIYEEGKIKIASDVINIVGKSLYDVTYVEDDTMADLTNNKVMFDEGFTVDNDFYIKLHVKNLIKNTKVPFLTIEGNNTKIEAYFCFNNYDRNSSEGVEQWAYYVELKVNYYNITYTIVSNYILEEDYNTNGMYFIGLKRQDNYYELYIEEVEE